MLCPNAPERPKKIKTLLINVPIIPFPEIHFPEIHFREIHRRKRVKFDDEDEEIVFYDKNEPSCKLYKMAKLYSLLNAPRKKKRTKSYNFDNACVRNLFSVINNSHKYSLNAPRKDMSKRRILLSLEEMDKFSKE